MQRILILLLIFPFALSANAQQYNFNQYTIANGLPSNTVYDIKQDKDGFIWIATESGLVRFDGRNFVTFTTQDGLPSNDILLLFPDSKGRMWIASMHNSLSYHYKGKIHSFRNDTLLQKMKFSSSSLFIRENEGGDMMFSGLSYGSTATIHLLTIEGKLVTSTQPESAYSTTGLASGPGRHEFTFTNYDSVTRTLAYFIYNGEWRHYLTLVYEPSAEKIKHYKKDNGVLKLVREEKIPDPGFPRAFLKYDLKNNKPFIEQRPPLPDRISTTDPHGWHNEFYGTANGTYYLDPGTGVIIDHLAKGKTTNRAFIDREGNFWIGTNAEGLLVYPSRYLKTLSLNRTDADILTLHKEGNTVYAGSTQGNLFIFRDNKISRVNFDAFIRHANNKTADNHLRWIEPSPDKKKLLCFDDFLLKYDPVTGKQQFSKLDVVKQIRSIGPDSLLISTGRAMMLLDTKTLAVLDTLYIGRSYSAIKLGNAYYIGTTSGPVRITPGSSPLNLSDAQPELNSLVNHMAIETDGSIWMSTQGNGIFRIRNDKVVQHINASNGLNSNNCKAMTLDNKFIWVGTEKGLNRINRHNFSDPILQFTTEDGLASNDIHSILSDSGTIYVGTDGHLTWFDSSKIKAPSVCLLRMLSIELGKSTIDADSLRSLRYNENNLTFRYTGLSFRSSNNILYLYRLKGFSDSWDSTRNSNLEFLALPPGEYVLEIFARNKFGQNSETITIPVVINPPFWNTWWFRLLVISIMVAIAWLVIVRRIRQEKEKANTQNRITELEQQALRSQMNPHFIFNCLNSIQNFLLQNNFEKTNEYLTAFAHLIRQTLDNSSRTTISIEAEMKYLSSYLELECMRFAYSFKYSIEVDPDIDTEYTHIPTMILQPYVENSIRHGIRYRQEGEKTVNVSFMKRGNTLVCIVQDSGVGRKKASELKSFMHLEYQSKGMRLTAERIEALNRRQDIPITVDVIDLEEAGNANGTQVIVRFPNMFL